MWCKQCNADTQTEYLQGTASCADCGFVQEESQIVSEIAFGENSAGGAVVQGAYVANDSRGARTQGPGGFRASGTGESRESTLANAAEGIRRLAGAKNVRQDVADKAVRLFRLAIEGGTLGKSNGDDPPNFVLGRRSEYSQASCLYAACRLAQTNHMLIDFADVIQVNVFILGRSYLRLVKCLNLKLPVIDPSIFISRFAAMLDFGDDTRKVAEDAARLVKRFRNDWLVEGRRPAGISGACLLLAARMNNYRRSITEIVQVVKIADVTLRARLEEFAKTPSAALTIDAFRTVELSGELEPPSLKRVREPTRRRKVKGETTLGSGGVRKRAKTETLGASGQAGTQGELADDDDDEEEEEEEEEGGSEGDDEDEEEPASLLSKGMGRERSAMPQFDPAFDAQIDNMLEEDVASYLVEPEGVRLDAELSKEEKERAERARNAPFVKPTATAASSSPQGIVDTQAAAGGSSTTPPPERAVAPAVESTSAPAAGLEAQQGSSDDEDAGEISMVVKPNPSQAPPTEDDPLHGLDEDELDQFILTEAEARIKERVWMEFNKDYLEQSLERQLKLEADMKEGIMPKNTKRKRNKPRDSSTAASSSALESTKAMLQKKSFSKKLNYSNLDALFASNSGSKGKKGSRKERTAVAALMDVADGEEREYFNSDAEDRSEPEIVEEDGPAPAAPNVRKRSRAEQAQREKRRRRQGSGALGDATSSAGESEAPAVGARMDEEEEDDDDEGDAQSGRDTGRSDAEVDPLSALKEAYFEQNDDDEGEDIGY